METTTVDPEAVGQAVPGPRFPQEREPSLPDGQSRDNPNLDQSQSLLFHQS
ncbi:MAG: hypothetical protein MK102_09210 [Fuerstiella sp.]|nr:hypothetical protein [Fuerstiella sp.]